MCIRDSLTIPQEGLAARKICGGNIKAALRRRGRAQERGCAAPHENGRSAAGGGRTARRKGPARTAPVFCAPARALRRPLPPPHPVSYTHLDVYKRQQGVTVPSIKKRTSTKIALRPHFTFLILNTPLPDRQYGAIILPGQFFFLHSADHLFRRLLRTALQTRAYLLRRQCFPYPIAA